MEYGFKEQVDHPKHYASSGLEPEEVIAAWKCGFYTGNALKYIGRAGKKPNEPYRKDVEKALWYLKAAVKRGIQTDTIVDTDLEVGKITYDKVIESWNLTGELADVVTLIWYGNSIDVAANKLEHHLKATT